MPCIYDRVKPIVESTSTAPSSAANSSTAHSSTSASSPVSQPGPYTQLDQPLVAELPESRSRRLAELSLLHHYATSTGVTLLDGDKPQIVKGWTTEIPQLALKHDALLYAIYAFTALHISKIVPNDAQALATHQHYLDLALRKHREAIGQLNSDTADQVLITSHFVRAVSFSNLSERNLQPYEPPVQWLSMANGVFGVFAAAWRWLTSNPDSITMRQIARARIFENTPNDKLDSALFLPTDDNDFLRILRHGPDCGLESANEPWDEQVEEAYTSTINYLGGTRQALAEGQPLANVCRRLVVFPLMIKPDFVALVAESRPRAMVVLAYYFALLSLFRGVWWISDTGRREVQGISSVLGHEWRDLMLWPLAVIQREPLHVALTSLTLPV